MTAVVVYESLWGNTAAIARAVAEGLGGGARALSTAEASPDALAGAGLLVVGAPLLGFSVPSDTMVDSIRKDPRHAAVSPPETQQPSMRAWLATVPAGTARFATFETRIWWSPGSAAGGIGKALAALGYAQASKAERFLVTGTYGPLKDGEVERARAWGAALAKTGA